MTKTFLITDFKATPDTQKVQTKKVQACIDACHLAGGGEVVIPAGTFIIGSIRLYSNMTLRLKSGAVLKGSKNLEDYKDFHIPTTIKYLYDPEYIKDWNLPPYYFYAMICAFQEENIAIIGEAGSIIDGQDVFDPNGEEKFRGPMGMILSQVNNVSLEGYTFENSSNWSHTLDGCEKIRIENVTIKAGHDGFNLHHSTNIRISNCRLETGDDCFAGYDVHNLEVSHCYLNTACNGMRISGTDLSFKHCIFNGPGHYPHLSEDTYYTHAIFKYYSVLADTILEDSEKIRFDNCVIHSADKLFSYSFGDKELHQVNQPLRELTMENMKISGIRKTSLFKGNGEKVTLTLKNVQLSFDEEEPIFLEIDDSVTLILENVFFETATKIRSLNQEMTLLGETTMVIENR
ncbi:MAG TPA: right-handed parallel beta-helix repeat-containing protein [Candidatus Tetragenococcus pullicola]|nr:right-handed parallel beta-helix repeat-containing protein [Candidatus Tetragenococcus pullicola]